MRTLIEAARPAGLHAFAVISLLAALVLWTGEGAGSGILYAVLIAETGGILFLITTAALVASRRFGIALLWLLLLGAWTGWPLLRFTSTGVLAGFIVWSILALPLYAMGLVAGSARAPVRLEGWRQRRATILIPLWMLLLGVGLTVTDPLHLFVFSSVTGAFPDPPTMVLDLARPVWGSFPFLVAADAIFRSASGAAAQRNG
jgi:hypothetical protein